MHFPTTSTRHGPKKTLDRQQSFFSVHSVLKAMVFLHYCLI